MPQPAATYQQIKEGVSDGVISKAEYRRYITDETLAEAEEAVAKIAEENPTLESLLGAQALQSAVNSNAQP